MPIRVMLPSGRVTTVDTDDPKVAAATARAFVAKDPYEATRAQLAQHPAAAAAAGGVETAVRGIPFLSELQAGINSGLDLGGDFLTGKQQLDPSAPLASLRAAEGKSWSKQRAIQQAYVDHFAAEHPVISNLTKGAAMAAPIATAIATGGASEAPAVAEAAPGVASFLKNAVTGVARRATAGAGAGAVYGAAQPGDLSQRAASAQQGAEVGAVVGGTLPTAAAAAGSVAKRAGTVIARTANKAAGGALLDANQVAAQRLTAALKADGATPDLVKTAMNGFLKNGATDPSLIDVASRLPSGGQNTLALVRGAAAKGSGRGVAVTYGDQVAADLQDKAIDRTRALTPDTTSAPAVRAGLDGEISTAAAYEPPPPGAAGTQVSGALNQAYDASKAQVNAAYDAARQNQGTATLKPDASKVMAQSVSDALGDFDPLSVPRVTREVGRIQSLVQPDLADLPPGVNPARLPSSPVPVRPIFEARARLSQLRQSADPVEGAAAGRAVRALDGSVDGALDNGQVTGDQDAVDAWRNAIGLRRQFGQQFEGDDLISRLTERARHGDGQALAVAPEDASSAIFGRGAGIANRPDMARDLSRLRDTLGADSPAWRAVQDEAMGRYLSQDAGTVDYGSALERFRNQAPDLHSILAPEDTTQAVSDARGQVAASLARRSALDAGATGLNAHPDDFALELAGARGETPDADAMAGVGYRQALTDAIGRPAEGSTGTLNRIATATNQARNLEATYGPDAAQTYRQGVQDLIDQMNNARFINPNTNSASAGRLMDAGLVDPPDIAHPRLSVTGVLLGAINKIRAGAVLTDAERAAIAQIGTAKPELGSIDLGDPALLPSQNLQDLQSLTAGSAAGGAQDQNKRITSQ